MEDEKSFEDELAFAFNNKRLDLSILPTEQCNFRCIYCYEDFSIGKMSRDTIRGVKRLIERRIDGLSHLSVSWFGGEPLLAFDVIEEISEHIAEQSAGREDFHYHSGITTNGYLLSPNKAERLEQLGVRHYQITLDGPEEIHNRTRVRRSGKGTFHQIWQNLIGIRDSSTPIDMLLRVHLTTENLPFLPRFLTRLRDDFLGDKRFKVNLRPIERLGGTADDRLPIVPQVDRSQIFADLEAILKGGLDTSEGIFSPPKVCYACRPNFVLIRANGTIGKCTVALSDPANSIGHLCEDGSLKISDSGLRTWMQGWVTRDWETLRCPYHDIKNQPQIVNIEPLEAQSAVS